MSNKKTFTKDELIIKKDTAADTAYMILSGSVMVYLSQGEKVVELATLEKGAIFGENALFQVEGGKYGANVKAMGDTELLTITPEQFRKTVNECDPMIQEIIRMTIERLRNTNEKLLKRETQEFMDIVLV